MKFSDVLGRAFFNIRLSSSSDCDLVDLHWSAGHHHHKRFLEADAFGVAEFHRRLRDAHLRHCFLIVFQRGDFAAACDPANESRELRDRWNPDMPGFLWPDPTMFDTDVGPDPRYLLGVPHEYDAYLRDVRPPGGVERLLATPISLSRTGSS